MRVVMLHSRVRVEERMLLDAMERRGVACDVIDVRNEVFDLSDAGRWAEVDLVLDRSLSLTSSLAAVRILETIGVRCVNPSRTTEICSDKLQTSLALERAGVPTPRVCVGLGQESALEAVERIGYPAVIKPTVGSWGRLVSRVNDRDSAEAVIEHRAVLGSAQQQVFYIQEHIDKPGRDLRIFVVGGEAIAGIERRSAHWLTNTALGATTAGVDVSGEIGKISARAAACVGGDIVAVDLLECPDRGLLVNEINHSMEFRNSVDASGVDIPGLVIEHALGLVGAQTGAPA
jgi:[lysine-biosynthesis-protein LysW]--L-2-aminoadipate ligase